MLHSPVPPSLNPIMFLQTLTIPEPPAHSPSLFPPRLSSLGSRPHCSFPRLRLSRSSWWWWWGVAAFWVTAEGAGRLGIWVKTVRTACEQSTCPARALPAAECCDLRLRTASALGARGRGADWCPMLGSFGKGDTATQIIVNGVRKKSSDL